MLVFLTIAHSQYHIYLLLITNNNETKLNKSLTISLFSCKALLKRKSAITIENVFWKKSHWRLNYPTIYLIRIILHGAGNKLNVIKQIAFFLCCWQDRLNHLDFSMNLIKFHSRLKAQMSCKKLSLLQFLKPVLSVCLTLVKITLHKWYTYTIRTNWWVYLYPVFWVNT